MEGGREEAEMVALDDAGMNFASIMALSGRTNQRHAIESRWTHVASHPSSRSSPRSHVAATLLTPVTHVASHPSSRSSPRSRVAAILLTPVTPQPMLPRTCRQRLPQCPTLLTGRMRSARDVWCLRGCALGGGWKERGGRGF
eukprot:310341-Chlamydomonas_euryale.AAC.1